MAQEWREKRDAIARELKLLIGKPGLKNNVDKTLNMPNLSGLVKRPGMSPDFVATDIIHLLEHAISKLEVGFSHSALRKGPASIQATREALLISLSLERASAYQLAPKRRERVLELFRPFGLYGMTVNQWRREKSPEFDLMRLLADSLLPEEEYVPERYEVMEHVQYDYEYNERGCISSMNTAITIRIIAPIVGPLALNEHWREVLDPIPRELLRDRWYGGEYTGEGFVLPDIPVGDRHVFGFLSEPNDPVPHVGAVQWLDRDIESSTMSFKFHPAQLPSRFWFFHRRWTDRNNMKRGPKDLIPISSTGYYRRTFKRIREMTNIGACWHWTDLETELSGQTGFNTVIIHDDFINAIEEANRRARGGLWIPPSSTI